MKFLGTAVKLLGKLFTNKSEESSDDKTKIDSRKNASKLSDLVESGNKKDIVENINSDETNLDKSYNSPEIELIKSKAEANYSSKLNKLVSKTIDKEPEPKVSLDNIATKYGVDLNKVENTESKTKSNKSPKIPSKKSNAINIDTDNKLFSKLTNIENLLKAQYEYQLTQNNILLATQQIQKLTIEQQQNRDKLIATKLKELNDRLHSANADKSELIPNKPIGRNELLASNSEDSNELDTEIASNSDSSGSGILSSILPILGLGGVGKFGLMALKGGLGNLGKTASTATKIATKPKSTSILSKLKDKTSKFAKNKIGAAFAKVGKVCQKVLGPKVGPKVMTIFTKLGTNLTKVGVKMGAKAGVKGIPIIGNLLGAVFGISDTIKRAKQGDALGAIIAGVGSLVNFFPFGGNYISMALDGLNIILDETREGKLKDTDEINNDIPEHEDENSKVFLAESTTQNQETETNTDLGNDQPAPVTERLDLTEFKKLETVKPIELKPTSTKDKYRAQALVDLENKPDTANVEAARYITANSTNDTRHRCAESVSNALYHAGIGIGRAHAYGYPKLLENAGYRQLSDSEKPEIGDISTIPPFGSHEYGHVAMYNGKNWVSDFLQNNKNIYSDKPKELKITTWRKPELASVERNVQTKSTESNETIGKGGDNKVTDIDQKPKQPVVINAPVNRTINNVTNNYIKDNNLMNLQLGNYDKH